MEITVIAHANSKRPKLKKDSSNTLHIYIQQPAVEGKANKAIISSLAKYLKIKKNKIYLICGHKNKKKTFLIN